jgi:hypothetical protein
MPIPSLTLVFSIRSASPTSTFLLTITTSARSFYAIAGRARVIVYEQTHEVAAAE